MSSRPVAVGGTGIRTVEGGGGGSRAFPTALAPTQAGKIDRQYLLEMSFLGK